MQSDLRHAAVWNTLGLILLTTGRVKVHIYYCSLPWLLSSKKLMWTHVNKSRVQFQCCHPCWPLSLTTTIALETLELLIFKGMRTTIHACLIANFRASLQVFTNFSYCNWWGVKGISTRTWNNKQLKDVYNTELSCTLVNTNDDVNEIIMELMLKAIASSVLIVLCMFNQRFSIY